jgi:hypothetical protein
MHTTAMVNVMQTTEITCIPMPGRDEVLGQLLQNRVVKAEVCQSAFKFDPALEWPPGADGIRLLN